MPRLPQLVVGGADHRPALQGGNGGLVQDPAQGTGGEQITVGAQNPIGFQPGAVDGGGNTPGRLSVDVGDDDLGARFLHHSCQLGSHLAHSLDGHPAAPEVGGVPEVGGDRPHRRHHTPGGERRWIPRSAGRARQSAHPAGGLGHPEHVLDGGAYVLGGDVGAAESLHQSPVCRQQISRLVEAGIADDHGLASSQVQACRRRLEAHPLRQA